MTQETKDEVLLGEILSICSKEAQNGNNILKKLTNDSKIHLLEKHTKLGVFMKIHDNYFDSTPNGIYITKKEQATKILNKPVKLDISMLNLFLKHFDSEKWILLSLAFEWLTKEQKSIMITGYDGILKFVEHNSTIFEINRNSKALEIRLKKSFVKEMKDSNLLNEVFEICSEEDLDTNKILSKLEPDSRAHLLKKYNTLDYFMQVHSDYFISSEKQEREVEKKPEKKKYQRFLYSIDFETDVNTPIEIGCVKIQANTGRVVDYFHEFINPGHIQRNQGSEWVSKNIHGLPYYGMKQLSNKSIKTIWNDFLNFIDYEIDPNRILFAKGKKTENNVINWFKKETNWTENLRVKDLFEIVQFYDPSLSRDKAMQIELQATRYLESVRKCKHHSTLNPLFHCALEDAYANAIFIQHGIEKSFSHFLTMGNFKRKSINESKRPSKSGSKKPVESIELKEEIQIETQKESKLSSEKEINNLIEKMEKMELKSKVEESTRKETKKESQNNLKKGFEIIELFEPQIRTIPPIQINENEVLELLKILPQKYFDFFHDKEINDLVDIEMDFNRIPKAHFFQKKKLIISEEPVTKEDIEYVTKNLNILPNNRTGIEKFLHRISIIRSIEDEIIGITLRVGKPIVGIANVISDILDEKKSILFLGPPGNEFSLF
jgi:competence protein ComGC